MDQHRAALYFDDIGGFRHSDTAPVTKEGYEMLTHYPVDQDSLIARERRTAEKVKGAVIRKSINVDQF